MFAEVSPQLMRINSKTLQAMPALTTPMRDGNRRSQFASGEVEELLVEDLVTRVQISITSAEIGSRALLS